MKKNLLPIMLILLALFLVGCNNDPIVDPKDNPTVDLELSEQFNSLAKDRKVYLTTTGQSDIDIVQNVLESATGLKEDEDFTRKEFLEASEVENNAFVILVVGTSAKGLGAAGTNVAAEKARAEAFGEKAVSGDIDLLVVHVGGQGRRGDSSDPIINAVCPYANLIIVVEAGNQDGLFTTLATNNQIPLYVFSKSSKMVGAFQTLFS